MSVNQASDSGPERGRLDKRTERQQTGKQQAAEEPTATQKMWHGWWRVTSSRLRRRGREGERRNNKDASSSQQNAGVCCELLASKAVVSETKICRLSHKQTNDGWIRGGGGERGQGRNKRLTHAGAISCDIFCMGQ